MTTNYISVSIDSYNNYGNILVMGKALTILILLFSSISVHASTAGYYEYDDNYILGMAIFWLILSAVGYFIGVLRRRFKRGEYFNYYKNGKIKCKENYENGKKHGEFIAYDENGQIEYKENYVNGKKHAEWVLYYKNGQLARKENYKNGKKHGEFIAYDENGQLIYKYIYANGKSVD
jgi:hypothetical protein